MTRTDQLADFILTAAPPEEALRAAVIPIVDTIGVMLGGRESEAARLAMAYARSTGSPPRVKCWATGMPQGAAPEVAALANAMIGHALDYDDSYPGAGHPSAPILAAAIAAGAIRGELSGRDLLDAFVVGFEVMAKFADAIGVGHYYAGWHVTCTSGVFGAAATAARLLGLDRERTLTALGIAGSLASGMQRNFGTTTKPLHSGLAARNGIFAANLALLGGSADDSILDGERGFFELYGAGRTEQAILDQLGTPYSLVAPGTAIKKYPCCFIAVRPIDALLRIRTQHDLTVKDVETIVCSVPLKALHAMIYPRPTTGLEGKFSTEYILAAAMLDGAIGLRSFSDKAIMRPAVRDLMERVEAREEARLRPEDPNATVSGPAKGGWIEIRIRTRDGREFTEAEHHPHGGPKNPFSWADVAAKFLDCAAFGNCDAERAKKLLAALEHIATAPDVPALLYELG